MYRAKTSRSMSDSSSQAGASYPGSLLRGGSATPSGTTPSSCARSCRRRRISSQPTSYTDAYRSTSSAGACSGAWPAPWAR